MPRKRKDPKVVSRARRKAALARWRKAKHPVAVVLCQKCGRPL